MVRAPVTVGTPAQRAKVLVVELLQAVATPQVLAWSDDGGVMWRRPEGRGPRGVLCVAVSDDGRLLVGTQSTGLWVY